MNFRPLLIALGMLLLPVGLSAASGTITFSSSSGVSGTTVTDGQGASTDISGVTLQFSATKKADGSALPMTYQPNIYPGANGLAAGYATNTPMGSYVIKSSSAAVNFGLQSLFIVDAGGSSGDTLKIEGFNNGSSTGSIIVTTATNPWYFTFNTATLGGSKFKNVNEIRITESHGNDLYISVNNVQIADAVSTNTFDLAGNALTLPTAPSPHETYILSSTSAPTVASTAASTIAATSATLAGNVTADGGASVTDRGIVWSTSSTLASDNTTVSIGTGTGTFSQSITGLSPSTTYYFRAFATNSIGTANGSILSFTTLPPAPTITNVAATSGPIAGGTSVTLTGTNFSGATAVTFGGTAAASYNVDSATQITATTPAHAAGAVDVVVTTAGGSATSTNGFTYAAAPTITALNPTSGTIAGGTSVTLTGTHFTGATAVNFGATAGTSVSVVSATSITVTSPAGSLGTVNVTVTTPGGTSATATANEFTYANAGTLEILSKKDPAEANFATSQTGNAGVSNLSSGFAISETGRYVAFISNATNLVADQTNAITGNVFLRDRTSNTTKLVSGVNGSATATTGNCSNVTISADGRYVSFASAATNLVSPGTSGTQAFLYDRDGNSGAGSLTLVSHTAASLTTGAGITVAPLISRDGSAIVFGSTAITVVSPFTAGTGAALYRYERSTGAITLASPQGGNTTSNTGLNSAAGLRAISDDGRWIVFATAATDAVASFVGSAVNNVFLFDAQAGTTRLLNRAVGTTATAANGATSSVAGIGSDGRYVAFVSAGTDLVSGQTGSGAQVYLYNRLADTITLVSRSTTGAAVGSNAAASFATSTVGVPVISRDGRFIAFASAATDLVGSYSGSGTQYYLYDRLGNAGAGSLALVTHTTANATTGTAGTVTSGALSPSGSRFVFSTTSSDLPASITNAGNTAIYAYTATTGAYTFLSGTAADGSAVGNGAALNPNISPDGTLTGFYSVATNLAANDNGGAADIFGSVQPLVTIAPEIYGTATASGTADTAFSYTITAANTPTSYAVTGTLPTGVTLNTSTGVLSGTPTQSGNFSLTLTATNAGGTSPNFVLSLTVAPAAPSAPDLAAGSDAGSSSTDNLTSVATPTFTGTAGAATTVRLYDTDGTTLLGTATADGSGNWSITSSTLAAGAHTLTAKATDSASNTSAASGSLVVTIDTTAPALQSAITLSDTALRIGDTATVTFTFAEAVTGFTTADVSAPNATLSNLASSDGGITWTATLTPAATTTDATNVLTLDYTGLADVAGNAGTGSATSGNYAVDTVRPTLASAITISDTALKIGDTATVTFTYTEAVTGFTIADVSAPSATLSSLASSDGGLTWTATLTPATTTTAATNVLTLDYTGLIDLAGNAGTGSATSGNYVVDTAAPSAPVVVAPANSSSTADNTPTITGTAEANSTVTVYLDGSSVGTPTADGSGNWSFTATTLSDASHTVKATATDTVGNVSADSATHTFTVDTTGPLLVSTTPADNATGLDPAANFVLTFDGPITAVAAKNIVIRRASDAATIATIDASDTAQVTVSGTAVTINPLVTLRYSTDYYIQIDAGAFTDALGNPYAGLANTTGYNFSTELRTEITVADSAAFADYFANPNIAKINLNAATTYDFPGGTVSRPLTIQGAAATSVIQAGTGITTDVIRTGTAGGVTLTGLGDYTSVKVFLSVTGSLTLQNLTLQNNGANAANNGFFTIVNVKNGGSLVADTVVVKDFHNNPTPGTNLAFGFHSEPTAVKLTVTGSTFGSTNALRNVIAARGGALTITGNTFTGTQYPTRLRNSDGYEYAIYIYGGWGDDSNGATSNDPGLIENNTLSNYVATTQSGYGSAAIAVIGFYPTRLSIKNNVLSGNSGDIDLTREWKPFSSPSPTVTINTLPLTTVDEAFALGEQLRTDNSTNKVNASLNQGDVVALGTAPSTYEAVFGGYRSPNLTLGTVTATSAVVTFANATENTDSYKAATAITLETLRNDQSTWTTAWTNPSGVPTSATVTLAEDHTYKIRAKFVHTGTDSQTLVTYTAPVTANTNTPPAAPIFTALATDAGPSATDQITNDQTLTLSGTAEANSTVTVSRTGTGVLGTTTANASGVWSYDYTGTTLPAGTYSFTATAADATNNVSTASSAFNVTIDLTAPTTTIATAALSPDTGTSSTDFLTKTAAQTISGTTSANLLADEIVQVSLDNGTSWTTATTSTGANTWSLAGQTLTASNTLKVRVADTAGNPSTAFSQAYVLDLTAPTLASAITISDTALKIGDTATVTFTFAEAVTGFTTADVTAPNATLSSLASSDGGLTWTATLTPSATTTAATNVLTLDYTGLADLAGNAGTGTATSGNYAIDTARPTATIVVATTSLKVGATSTVTVTFTEAVTGFTIADLTAPNAVLSNLTTSDGGVTWTATLTPSATTTAATNVLTLDNTGITDLAGNAGTGTTTSNTYAIDTVLPTLTSVAIASNNLNPIWAKTGDTVTVTFTTSEAVATPTATVAGHAATIAHTSGNTYTATTTMLAGDSEGAVTFSLAFSDTTGNAGTAVTATTNASAVTFDRTAPTAPAITAITTDTGTSSTDFVTSDPTLTLSGTAEANSTVTVSRLGTGILGTATANGSGAWSYDYTATTLAAGEHTFTATATDAASNASPASSALIVTVDTATAAPVIASITTDTGASATDGITSDTTLTLTGTAEANSTVTLTRSASPTPLTLGTATADGTGAWSFVYATTLVDGSYLFNASSLDLAGNTSAASADFPVVIDTAAPVAPVIAAITTDTGTSATDRITSDPTLVLSGTAEANTAVTVSRTGTGVLGTATASGTGAWSYDYTGTTLADGSTTFTATATDAAGNVSTATADFTVTIDTTTPTLTSVAIASNNAVTTRAKVGDTVTVTFTASEAVTTPSATLAGRAATIVNTTGHTYTAALVLAAGDPEGTATFSVAFTDLAGNAGTAATATTDASAVAIDATVPTLTSVAIASNNPTTTRAKVGDTVTVTFTASEAIQTPTAILAGRAATVTNTAGNTYTATLVLAAGDPEGTVTFSLAFTDLTGNAGTAVSATTDSSAVNFDRTAPTLTAVAIASSNAAPIWAKTGDVVTVTFTASEAIATPSATLAGHTATIAHTTGNTYTATTTMLGTDTEGVIAFALTFVDVTGNTGTVVTATTNSSAVTFDKTAPLITSPITASTTYKSAFTYNIVATGSAAAYGATGLPPGITLDAATGAITGAVTTNGSFTVALSATDAAGNIGTASLALDVAKVNLTVAGITAASRIYDATPVAALTTTSAALVGIVVGDTVTLSTASAAGAFATKTIGTAKPVTISGLAISGPDSANYTLTQPATTADITAKALTVTGITAASKIYDGNTVAALTTTGATLVGVIAATPAEAVTLVTGAATGAFANANAGFTKTVQVSGLALTGADAGNYTVTQPTTTANISPANVTIAFSGLSHTYDGTPKSATITASPTVPLSIVYSNAGGVAPTQAGSYLVSANVTDPNYSGNGNATLVIAKAAQTVAFALTGANFNVGSTLGLVASASSGLPVTFSVVSGTASLAGTSATITSAGPTTLRATQAGNDNYLPASADQSFTGVASAKTAQTIAFAALADRITTDLAFDLSATASSGLPVSFTLVSGPAFLSGTKLTLIGAPGLVIVRASQAGDATFAAAPDVTRSFTVTDAGIDTFFGDLFEDLGLFGGTPGRGELLSGPGARAEATKSGDIAAVLFPGTRRGSLIIVSASLGLNVSLDFTLNPDGTYTVPFTSAGRSLNLTGSLTGSTLVGRLPALRVAFSTQVQARTGLTAGFAGYYESESLNTATGGTASIVGPNGQLLIVASTATVSTGALGTVSADGTFTVAAPGATISGAVDAPTTTVSGTIVVPGQPTVNFSGLAATTARTDRLINLSSRVRVGPSAGRTLITGFVIGGTDPKRVLLRAVGPALTGFGVQGALSNPRIMLYDGTGKLLLENDDWSGADTAESTTRVGAFALAAGSKDAALFTTLAPGAYTMHVVDGGETGVALAEIYDASVNPNSEYQRLVNISTRGEAGTGENVLIGGFIVTGNAPKKVLVRGIGPGLAAFGVPGTLADPRLRVFRDGALLGENDHWSDGPADTSAAVAQAARDTGAFTLAPGSKDAALILTLAPGAYTAQVGAADGSTTGVALVEIYELP